MPPITETLESIEGLTIVRRGMTAAEYFALPETNRFHELFEGDLIVAAAPNRRHQRVAYNLTRQIDDALQDNELGEAVIGPINLRVDSETVLEPDMVVLHRSHPSFESSDAYLKVAPSLVVEVLSPSTARYDRSLKLAKYAKVGVPVYWLVDTVKNQIEEFRLKDGALEASASFEGGTCELVLPFIMITVDLKEVFD